MAAMIAVHIAKSICMESKKKNMISSDTDAPSGKHSACIVSSVWTSIEKYTELRKLVITMIIIF